jgi:hypothetical protein
MSAVLLVNQAFVDALMADPKYKAMVDGGELIVGINIYGGKTLSGLWVDELCNRGMSPEAFSWGLTQLMSPNLTPADLMGAFKFSDPVKTVPAGEPDNRTARRKREAQERNRRPPRKARY